MPLPALRPFRVVTNVPLADDAFSLTLVPDDGQPMFEFVAGQWINLHLLNEDGTSWARAAFSIANAPSEAQTSIDLALKVYGDFTKRARTLREGDLVHVQGPFGVFTLRSGSSPLVFFAGGIGITPLRSMIREVVAQNDPREMLLIYSNKTQAGTSYEQEFRELAKTHPTFRAVFCLTAGVPSGWEDEAGRIDASLIEKHVKDAAASEYFMCGPRAFMDSIKEILAAKGVDVKTKLRKELFG